MSAATRRKLSTSAAIGALLALLAAHASCGESEHPSDSELVENFRAHRAEFEKLLQMFLADKELGRVAYDFTRPSDARKVGVTGERLKEYRALFDKLGLSAGIEGYGEKEGVMLHASTRGLSVTGSSKGYAHLRERPELVVEDLDTYWSKDGKSFMAFRHVEGDWYLYFDYED